MLSYRVNFSIPPWPSGGEIMKKNFPSTLRLWSISNFPFHNRKTKKWSQVMWWLKARAFALHSVNFGSIFWSSHKPDVSIFMRHTGGTSSRVGADNCKWSRNLKDKGFGLLQICVTLNRDWLQVWDSHDNEITEAVLLHYKKQFDL